MFEIVMWLAVFFIFGFSLGIVIAGLYWRKRVNDREICIVGLQASLIKRVESLQNLQAQLTQKEANNEQSNEQIQKLERLLADLNTGVEPMKTKPKNIKTYSKLADDYDQTEN